MTAQLHALPGLQQANPDLPRVTRDIDGHKYAIDVDVTDLVDLQRFFTAITSDDHLRNALRILLWNDNPSPKSRDLRTAAAADLRKSRAIRQALTFTLTPEQADLLHEELEEKAMEPDRCEAASGDCSAFVADDGTGTDEWSGLQMCPNHLAIVRGD